MYACFYCKRQLYVAISNKLIIIIIIIKCNKDIQSMSAEFSLELQSVQDNLAAKFKSEISRIYDQIETLCERKKKKSHKGKHKSKSNHASSEDYATQ